MHIDLSASTYSGSLTDDLAFFKYGYVLLCFVATLLAGFSARKLLTWQEEKLFHLGLRFAAGVCLGTAMLDLLSLSNDLFSTLFIKFSYPLAFVLLCTGYIFAMLVDWLIAAGVRRDGNQFFNIVKPNTIDKIMPLLVRDFYASKSCDSNLPVSTSKSSTKECDGIGDIKHHILYQAMLFGDCIVIYLTVGQISNLMGVNMWEADTKYMAWRAFLSATLYNMTYAVSVVFTLQRLAKDRCFLFVMFALITPVCFILALVISKTEFIDVVISKIESISGPDDSLSCACIWAIYFGFFSGVLVYISVHHLLADGRQLKMSVSKIRLGDSLMMGSGIGVIALLKALGM